MCAGAVALLAAGTGAADVKSPLTLPQMELVFLPRDFATHYSVAPTDKHPKRKLHYTWTLALKLVDPAGAKAPGVADSGAAVDPPCTDSKLAGGSRSGEATYVWQSLGKEFVWYHGDKGDYPDAPAYGCDHKLMGPSGHQGTVTVAVTDGIWQCTETVA